MAVRELASTTTAAWSRPVKDAAAAVLALAKVQPEEAAAARPHPIRIEAA